MWYPVALLGAAFLLQVVAEDPPHNRTKRLTAFGKSPNSETDPKSKLRSLSVCLHGARLAVFSVCAGGSGSSVRSLSQFREMAPVCSNLLYLALRIIILNINKT